MSSTAKQEVPTIEPGQRVRALYPNSAWGEGDVVSVDPKRRMRNPATGRMMRCKPLTVLRDDGVVGNFHLDQVEVVLGDAVEVGLGADRGSLVVGLFRGEGDDLKTTTPSVRVLNPETKSALDLTWDDARALAAALVEVTDTAEFG